MALNKWNEVLNNMSKTLKSRGRKRQKKVEKDPFDIFPDWFKSIFSNKKDKEISKEKDGYKTGVENYLAKKRSHKKITPVTYNNKEDPVVKSMFSSPPDTQEIVEPTNMGGYDDLTMQGVEYGNPVISTKETPTSKKLGVPRPGPSTFIQTAKYNPQTKRLNIQYTDGKIFPYNNVSFELADRIMNKKAYHSPGQELLNTIFYGHGTTRADEISDIDEGM